MDETIYLASLVEGLMPSAKVLHRLLTVCKTPSALWHQWGDALLKHALPGPTAAKWQQKPLTWQTEAHLHHVAQQMTCTGTQLLLWQDLPECLNAIADPPAYLFARGNTRWLNHSAMLGIVGTRQATEYSRHMTASLLRDLRAYQPVIISGMAAGVDGMAHQAALDNGLPTIAVLGTGLNCIYPAHHAALVRQVIEADGLMLSEYPMGFAGDRFTFPARNRIIAGLSQGVLVTECPVRSGAMITARVALENGREVLALPGNVLDANAAGPNQLIAQGATPVLNASSITDALQWPKPDIVQPLLTVEQTITSVYTPTHTGHLVESSKASNTVTPPDLPPDLLSVWTLLTDEPQHLDTIAAKLPESTTPLQVKITLLELSGHIKQLPGQLLVKT
jgi:DNA processing protein